jgi:hypothetical protein
MVRVGIVVYEVTMGRGFLKLLRFSLSVSLHHSIFIFIYTLLYSNGLSSEAWKHSKSQCSPGNQPASSRTGFRFFRALKGLGNIFNTSDGIGLDGLVGIAIG